MSALASNGSKNAATTNLTEADRANRLFRMRSKISRNEKDASSMPRFEAQDAAKLVRSRLNADETASLRAAFSMFASAKDADKLKTKKLWSVMRALGLAPTPLEFEKLAKDMDKRENGVIKWSDFLKVCVNA
jgi:Ca2+-binding EF-hand superfamily protein